MPAAFTSCPLITNDISNTLKLATILFPSKKGGMLGPGIPFHAIALRGRDINTVSNSAISASRFKGLSQ
jgi:hypothetical protein